MGISLSHTKIVLSQFYTTNHLLMEVKKLVFSCKWDDVGMCTIFTWMLCWQENLSAASNTHAKEPQRSSTWTEQAINVQWGKHLLLISSCEVSSAKLAAALAISFMFTVSVAKRLNQMNHSDISCQNLAYYEVCCMVGEKKECVRMWHWNGREFKLGLMACDTLKKEHCDRLLLM